MFEPGELIYYGTGGLCVVEEVTKLDISGADRERLYYRLSPFPVPLRSSPEEFLLRMHKTMLSGRSVRTVITTFFS